jgi:hypothetical protein
MLKAAPGSHEVPAVLADLKIVYVKRDVAANFRFHLKASRHPLRQSVPLPWRRAALHSGIERWDQMCEAARRTTMLKMALVLGSMLALVVPPT